VSPNGFDENYQPIFHEFYFPCDKDDICIKLLGDWKGGKQNKSNMSQLLKRNSFQQIPKKYIPILVLIIILGGHVPGQ
jgi:hypothetical protein